MAKVVITKWACDRCGEVHEKQPETRGRDQYVLKMTCVGEWSSWDIFDWKELCHQCNRDVEAALDALRYRSAADSSAKPTDGGSQ
jgi:hypothetical protein